MFSLPRERERKRETQEINQHALLVGFCDIKCKKKEKKNVIFVILLKC